MPTSPLEDLRYYNTILDAAEHLSRSSVTASPTNPEPLYLHARITARQGHHATAVACLTRAIQLRPSEPAYATALADLLDLLDETDDRPLIASESTAGAWLSLGRSLAHEGRFFEAADAYRQVLDRKPDCLTALVRLGMIEALFGAPEVAVRYCRAALTLDPEHSGAHQTLGWAWHLLGDTSSGWDEFAWLNDPRMIRERYFEQPLWDGSAIEGRTMLLWAGVHYGLGDTLHLARYITPLSNRGARIVVECQPSLAPLIATVPGVDTVAAHGAPKPSFDVHAPLMWIPTVDRTLRSPVPASVPYVFVDLPHMEFWGRRLGAPTGRRIGLRWGGLATRREPSKRSAPLAAFALLADIPNVDLISLQTGPQADELLGLPTCLQVRQLLDDSCTIVETAALIMNLDLVISVDTMVAHLAGALGKPVWTLLPAYRDWRWPERGRTHWYPTMRTFRQYRPGDWSDVMKQIRAALLRERPEVIE